MTSTRTVQLAVIAAALLGSSPALAQSASPTPIADALRELGADVRIYNDHLVTLANPFMMGRVPGSRGMEIAKEYCEYYLKRSGLQPPFTDKNDSPTYRQAFPLSRITRVLAQRLLVKGELLQPGIDFNALGYGAKGTVEAGVVFVGYGIETGPDGYSSFGEDADFTGKVVLMLRFEPMDARGKSLWAEGRAQWTPRHQVRRKLRALKRRGAAAILIANTPGAADPRTHELAKAGFGRPYVSVPVAMLTTSAGDRLVRAMDPERRSLLQLRKLADETGGTIDFEGKVRLEADLSREPFMAENVGGLLRGRGGLKDEYIVVGAHLDHLGMGSFGSRDFKNRGKKLHPGADDNASGSSAVLMLADKMVRHYRQLPADKPARTVLFLCFSAEESGLVGSQFYVKNPIAPLAQHALMINFDMIGRIKNKRLAVYNTRSAKGMDAWLQPFFDRSPLDIQKPAASFGGSDHMAFEAKRVPNIFAIIADFHQDYHTPRDESWKINRTGAVHTVQLFAEIGMAAATRSEPFVYQKRRPRRASRQRAGAVAAGGRAGLKVSFGIMPGSYDEDEKGVLVGGVVDGGAAEKAGLQEGDRLVTWNGKEIGDVRSWMGMLAKHTPGDRVKVGVLRDGKMLEKTVTLAARR